MLLGSVAPHHGLSAGRVSPHLVHVGINLLLLLLLLLCAVDVFLFSVIGQTRIEELLPGFCRRREARCLEHAKAIKCVMCASFKLTLLKQQCYF